MQGFLAQPSPQGVHLHGVVDPALFIEPQEGGLVAVNGRWYSGKVLLTGYNMVMAINYVDLEDYVASVVDAEMGSRFSPRGPEGAGGGSPQLRSLPSQFPRLV
jgi:stage II sporulation protein D